MSSDNNRAVAGAEAYDINRSGGVDSPGSLRAGAAAISRRWRVAAAAAFCAGLLTACSSDADTDDSPGDADAAPIAAESPGADDGSSNDDASDGEPDDDASDGDAGPSGGGNSGTAQWAGETYTYDSVRCQDQSQFGQFTMIANGPDAPTLAVQIEFDPREEPDLSQPTKVELFFGEPGGTVGDGEGYTSPYGPVDGATSSENGASGSVQLEADDSTTAADVNPDGGQLDFEIACG